MASITANPAMAGVERPRTEARSFELELRIPDAVQREAQRNGASLIRDPYSASVGAWVPVLQRTTARFALVLRCARDTYFQSSRSRSNDCSRGQPSPPSGDAGRGEKTLDLAL